MAPRCSKVYPACLEVMKITQPLRMAPNIFAAQHLEPKEVLKASISAIQAVS